MASLEFNEKEVLYFGFDESNHAGKNRKGEIVAGVVSSNRRDSIVRAFPNTRNYSGFNEWLNRDYFKDFRFTILTGDKYRYRSSSSNLAEVIPLLIQPFIFPNVKCVKIYLDGRLSKDERALIKQTLLEYQGIEKVVVGNFIKKKTKKNSKKNKKNTKEFRKGPFCPAVVYWADVIANKLLSEEVQTLLSHPKFIPYR